MKGSILDLFGSMYMALFVIVTIVLLGYTLSIAVPNIAEAVNSTSPMAAEIVEKSDVSSIFMNMLPLIVLAIFLSAVIMAYFIPAHPIFLPMSIIMLAIAVFISFYFSDIFYAFFNVEGISSYVQNFPLVVWIGQYFPYIVLFFGILLVLVMYFKIRGVTVMNP